MDSHREPAGAAPRPPGCSLRSPACKQPPGCPWGTAIGGRGQTHGQTGADTEFRASCWRCTQVRGRFDESRHNAITSSTPERSSTCETAHRGTQKNTQAQSNTGRAKHSARRQSAHVLCVLRAPGHAEEAVDQVSVHLNLTRRRQKTMLMLRQLDQLTLEHITHPNAVVAQVVAESVKRGCTAHQDAATATA